MGRELVDSILVSPKKYGVAVSLCLVFGTLGIHHFYLGNWIHGFLDFAALVGGITLIAASDNSMLVGLGVMMILADIVHTIVVTIMLLVGKTRDGQGLVVVYPGQFK
ncbi:MAG: TM2 domain-containing protein [Alphaproteobacteria bacterium]|nr:MAG: TM2 domain-containing protein [Alphaproteobacteria bacterium]